MKTKLKVVTQKITDADLLAGGQSVRTDYYGKSQPSKLKFMGIAPHGTKESEKKWKIIKYPAAEAADGALPKKSRGLISWKNRKKARYA